MNSMYHATDSRSILMSDSVVELVQTECFNGPALVR